MFNTNEHRESMGRYTGELPHCTKQRATDYDASRRLAFFSTEIEYQMHTKYIDVFQQPKHHAGLHSSMNLNGLSIWLAALLPN